VALVYIARLVGSHWFGVLQLGVAFSAYALITAEWGMCTLGVREVARLQSTGAVLRYARAHMGLLGLMALVVLGGGILILPLFPFYKADAWVFLLYLAAVLPQFATLEWVGIGLERMTWVGVAKLSRSLIYVVLVLLLLQRLEGWGGWPAYRWVPVLFLVSFCGSVLIMACRVRSWLGGTVLPTYGGSREWRRRLSAAGPIGASQVTMRVLLNVDVILLGILVVPEVVGSYAAAAKIIFVLLVAAEVLWQALLPRLARLWQRSPLEFRLRYNLYLGVALAGFLPVAAGGIVLGPRFMQIVYGESFPGAGAVFQVLSLSYVILAVGQFFGNGLIASDRQRDYFPPLLISGLVAVVASLFFVPRYGGIGASYGMLTAHTFLLLGTGWISRGLLGHRLWLPLLTAMVGSVILGTVLFLLQPLPFAVLLPLGVVSYVLVVGPVVLFWARRLPAARSETDGV
jgi:O-antigen/teichoic acid export membrane protein